MRLPFIQYEDTPLGNPSVVEIEASSPVPTGEGPGAHGKGGSNWSYAAIPVAGPLVGGVLAGVLLRLAHV